MEMELALSPAWCLWVWWVGRGWQSATSQGVSMSQMICGIIHASTAARQAGNLNDNAWPKPH